MLNRNAVVVFFIVATVLGLAAPAKADDTVDGRLGPGALYRLVRPTAWNGALVLYAHGFVSPDQPVAIPPDAERVIALFVPQGFAVAVSSFSETGWAVKDGAQRTHQLLGIFTSKFGNPSRIYAAGGSMGGLIAIKLVETYPGKFVGLFAACPVAGGLRPELEYFANVRILFDLFYPGVLPGTLVDVPADVDVTSEIIVPAIAAMSADLTGASTIARVTQTPVPFASAPELVQSIVTALVGATAYPHVLSLTHGRPFFDNSGTDYTGTLPPVVLQSINANVQRFSASPAGLNYIDQNYTPTGDLQIPALTLSTFRDPLAPRFHRDLYGATVAAAGNSDLLVQHTVLGSANGYGHCTFTTQELATAFSQLVQWVEFGIKPAP